MKSHRPAAVAAAAIGCLLLSSGSHALTIVPSFQNNSAYGTLGTWTSTEEQVVNQAISDWEGRILDNQTLDVTFDFTNVANGYLAEWNGNYSVTNGTDMYPWTPGIVHVVNVNTYWMNPAAPNQLAFTTGAVPTNDWDALTAIRHELGHAMGFVENFYKYDLGGPDEYDKWTQQISPTYVFDPGGLNVQMETDEEHTANSGSTANDLMNAKLVNGIRRGISTTDLEMLELAYGYDMIPGDAIQNGTVDLADLLTLVRNFGKTGATWSDGDFNGDGTVNLSDFLTLSRNFGQNIGTYAFPPQLTSAAMQPALASDGLQGSASVDLLAQTPEPAALGLLAIAGIGVLPRKRRTGSV